MSEPLVALELTRWVDPASVFLALHAGDDDAFWLDAGPSAQDGWSWVGTGEPENDPDAVRAVDCTSPEWEAWPAGRFRGGWVGWLDYDHAAAGAGAPAHFDADTSAEQWIRVSRFVAFDHAAGRCWAVAAPDAVAELASAVARIDVASAPPLAPAPPAVAHQRHTAEDYALRIERCRDAIREGDAYQLCLTTRFEIEAPKALQDPPSRGQSVTTVDPLDAYRRLRAATPAHHGGLVRSGPIALASASPERFLEVERGVVRTRPIKGTRPRSADAAADAALAEELRTDEKERAENVMIVDLMRNDLSRVCDAGSVGVDALLAVESYPAVHQLVSTVSGTLRAGVSVGELLDAAFPAGSMTGAPKLSAMTILHELEGAPRGVFAGCFGWVGDDGALDLAMVIRSIVVHPGGAYVGAGGGITWRSNAAAEVAEVGIKARGPLAALGAALPPGW
ncbi:anthranilate synthase component I family protein [Microbacterium sp. CFBP9034]|uniref:anthranilate synthase component I family protein n=1 Tax=Microbacterium sp. CFBP9034 TaxID=3096540 RepID=UPI002A6B5503|nr:anthranilate synthase component I family protein [Microbacterium sp. CFBP9034]MDY0909636.1 anthranilate synthase component I family protein [Microbacterium sp. CFBP9034]